MPLSAFIATVFAFAAENRSLASEQEADIRPGYAHEAVRGCLDRADASSRPFEGLACLHPLLLAGDRPDLPKASREVVAEQLTAALGSRHWDVQDLSIFLLGLVGAREAIPELERIAATHWHPAIRDKAASTAAALAGPCGRTQSHMMPESAADLPPDCPALPEAPHLFETERQPACESGVWEWAGHEFRASMPPDNERPYNPLASARVFQPADGWLMGTSTGEWPGVLIWAPTGGEAVTVIDGANISSVVQTEDGVLIAGGGGGMAPPYGHVHLLTWHEDAWRPELLARLPDAVDGARVLGDGLYAAWSPRSAFIFSDEAVLGMAECQPVAED
ncbi:hypothetical protein FKB34_05950 [Glycocaulis profundi]|nr:hypothetical protein FKB34_05950 [Glycocaulis profundi]